MLIRKLMAENPATCYADSTCSDAAKLMWECDCGVIPVVDRSSRLIGIITDRDICMATYTQAKPPHEIRVGDVMSRQVYSCQADRPLEDAAAIMQKRQVRRLPIVDNSEKLVGMLSISDIIRVMPEKATGKEDSSKLVSQVLTAVCRPRSRAGVAMAG